MKSFTSLAIVAVVLFAIVVSAAQQGFPGYRSLLQTASSAGSAVTTCPLASGNLKVGIWQGSKLPLLQVTAKQSFVLTPASTAAFGFEFDLVKQIAVFTNCKVTVVLVPDLNSRISYLLDGTIDAVVAQLSYTPGRELQIDFVRPFYYASGAALYTSPENADAITSWASTQDINICAEAGYYAINRTRAAYRVTIKEVPDEATAINKVSTRDCLAYMQDSTAAPLSSFPIIQKVPPIFLSPYGIGVAKGQTALYRSLSAFVVSISNMGPSSWLTQAENATLVPAGVGPLGSLNTTVTSISYFVQ